MHPSMPIIHPEQLIGQLFPIPQDNGELLHATIVEAINSHQHHVDEDSVNIQFRCSVNNNKYENNQIVGYLNRDNDDPVIWRFSKIIAHQGPLDSNHKDY